MLMKKERLFGLDIIRSLAIFLVFLIHMIAISGVTKTDVVDLKWGIMSGVRFLALNCAAVFAVNGFLAIRQKTVS